MNLQAMGLEQKAIYRFARFQLIALSLLASACRPESQNGNSLSTKEQVSRSAKYVLTHPNLSMLCDMLLISDWPVVGKGTHMPLTANEFVQSLSYLGIPHDRRKIDSSLFSPNETDFPCVLVGEGGNAAIALCAISTGDRGQSIQVLDGNNMPAIVAASKLAGLGFDGFITIPSDADRNSSNGSLLSSLSISPLSHKTFGICDPNSTYTTEFRVRNNSDDVVSLAPVGVSCNCTQLLLKDTVEIRAGEECPVQVVMDSGVAVSSHNSVIVVARQNQSSARQFIRLHLFANQNQYGVVVAPQQVAFGYKNVTETSTTQYFTVSSKDDHSLAVLSATCSLGGITIRQLDKNAAHPECRFAVVLDPEGMAIGSYNGTIEIETTDAKINHLAVPVSFTIGPSLQLPKSIAFGKVLVGESRTKTIDLGEYPNGITCEVVSAPIGCKVELSKASESACGKLIINQRFNEQGWFVEYVKLRITSDTRTDDVSVSISAFVN